MLMVARSSTLHLLEVNMPSKDVFKLRFTQHRLGAKHRGIPFLLSLDQWKTIWIESGHWEQRGNRRDKYCMCRVGDFGAYEVGNVFIALFIDNIKQAHCGKTTTADIRAKISASKTGVKIACRQSDIDRSKQIRTPDGVFRTQQQAAMHFSVTPRTVRLRCLSSNFHDWNYA